VRVTSPGEEAAAGHRVPDPKIRGYDAAAEKALRKTGGIPLTLRIGVSGHRLLSDPDTTLRQVADALQWLADQLRLSKVSQRSPVCLQMLTPLAAGADQKVAEVVGRLPVAGTTLVVPVPSDEARYRDSIAEDDPDNGLRTYDRLRASAAVTVLPGTTADDAGFRKLGEWVADHCDVLLALWDGVPPPPPDADGVPSPGTAAIVGYTLSHPREIPVIVIPAPRSDRTYEPGHRFPPAQLLLAAEHANPFLALWLRMSSGRGSKPRGLPSLLDSDPRPGHAEESSRAVRSWLLNAAGGRALRRSVLGLAVRHVRRFNARPGPKPDGSFSALTRQALDGAAPASDPAGSPAAVREAARNVEAWALTRYLRADWLAGRYQKAFRFVDQSVYVLAAVSVVLAAVRTIWTTPGSATAAFVTFLDLAVLATVSAILIGDVRGHLRDRWLSFRAMAEYLRMHMFLAVIYPRISGDPPSLTPLALNEFVGPAWFGSGTLALWWHRPPAPRPWSDADVPLLKGVLRQWVTSQRLYHQSKGRQHAGLHRRFLVVVTALFVITVLAALVHVFASGAQADDALNFVALGVPGVAAAFGSMATSAEHRRLSIRHRSSTYQLTSLYLPAIGRVAALTDLRAQADSLGSFMLAEATDWYAVLATHADEIPA
jgi:hypothetical protein